MSITETYRRLPETLTVEITQNLIDEGTEEKDGRARGMGRAQAGDRPRRRPCRVSRLRCVRLRG